ncbi:MAG: SDR family oxidoreductase [Spirochaetes bacterium]|nr:SDR family oxidoreductase [Spirochaetota bacterium]
MNLHLENKIAVITAASKGLGKAVASELSKEGALCVICSRDSNLLHKTAEEIMSQTGNKVIAYPCDVTNPDDIAELKDAVLKEYGRVDILFTNAGGPPAGFIQNFSPDDYRKAIELNCISAINLIYAFLPLMQTHKYGRIIASTSITVKQPIDNLVLSNVSRVGVIAFVKSIANQYGKYNITANAIAPGYILTDRLKTLIELKAQQENITYEKALAAFAAEIPLQRIGMPEEFASLVAFLASEKAGYINGQTILIDGGMYKGLM